jgi:hypothetical protein
MKDIIQKSVEMIKNNFTSIKRCNEIILKNNKILKLNQNDAGK